MKKSPNLSINHTTYQGITQPHGIRVRTRIPDEGAWDWLESFFGIRTQLYLKGCLFRLTFFRRVATQALHLIPATCQKKSRREEAEADKGEILRPPLPSAPPTCPPIRHFQTLNSGFLDKWWVREWNPFIDISLIHIFKYFGKKKNLTKSKSFFA